MKKGDRLIARKVAREGANLKNPPEPLGPRHDDIGLDAVSTVSWCWWFSFLLLLLLVVGRVCNLW